MHLPLTFPCKDIYEKVNTTLEGLAVKDRLEGSPDFLDDRQDDDDDDEDDDEDGDDDKPKKNKTNNKIDRQEEEFDRMLREMQRHFAELFTDINGILLTVSLFCIWHFAIGFHLQETVRKEFLKVNLEIRALRVQECEKGTFASDLQKSPLCAC